MVSTHAPARGRLQAPSLPAPGDVGFNSRPREGATAVETERARASEVFQLTPPRGGDAWRPPGPSASSGFQLTPPRGGDVTFCVSALRRGVSTHAPARGRLYGVLFAALRESFNSRPREGATQ